MGSCLADCCEWEEFVPQPRAYFTDTCVGFVNRIEEEERRLVLGNTSIAQLGSSKRHWIARINGIAVYIELPDGYPYLCPIVSFDPEFDDAATKSKEVNNAIQTQWTPQKFLTDICNILNAQPEIQKNKKQQSFECMLDKQHKITCECNQLIQYGRLSRIFPRMEFCSRVINLTNEDNFERVFLTCVNETQQDDCQKFTFRKYYSQSILEVQLKHYGIEEMWHHIRVRPTEEIFGTYLVVNCDDESSLKKAKQKQEELEEDEKHVCVLVLTDHKHYNEMNNYDYNYSKYFERCGLQAPKFDASLFLSVKHNSRAMMDRFESDATCISHLLAKRMAEKKTRALTSKMDNKQDLMDDSKDDESGDETNERDLLLTIKKKQR